MKASLQPYFIIKGMDSLISNVNCIGIVIGLFIGVKIISNNSDYYMYAICLLYTLFSLFWTFVMFVSTESWLVCASRCVRITEIETESLPVENLNEFSVNESGKQLMQEEHGKFSIVLKDFKMKYRPELPLVLKGLNIQIKQGEKVGIVGRTGAGKSSILQCLLRMYEPEPGSSYEFFGFDALKMNLQELRQLISIIPQTPFLFKNTVRMNLDPDNKIEDKDIWASLRQANLEDLVEGLPEGLDYFIERPI